MQDRVYDVSPYVASPCGQKLVACNRTAVDFTQVRVAGWVWGRSGWACAARGAHTPPLPAACVPTARACRHLHAAQQHQPGAGH